jgi:7-carboxy-7-deazaguanine synthase
LNTSNTEIILEELPLMEAFYTLQGEGTYQGNAAYFIRLAGCDVGCVWCDVKDSWEEEKHPRVAIESIVAKANNHPARLAVVTGGEPLMHNLDRLTNLLHAHSFKTNIETSGSHPLSGNWDWICLSPKKFKAPLPEVLKKADELKVIVFNKSDFAWAESFMQDVKKDCQLFLQPEWGKKDEMLPLIVQYIQHNPKWKLSLQSHKYIGIE